MSAFKPINNDQTNVSHSKHISAENEDKTEEAGTKPAETASPQQPEAK